MRSGTPPDDGGSVVQACRAVVQALIARYQWRAVDGQVLLAAMLADARPDMSLAALGRLVIRHYAQLLYAACGPDQPIAIRDLGYSDLFSYLYRIALQRSPEQAPDLAQRAIELVCAHYGACVHQAAFLAFARFKLLQARQEAIRATSREQPIDAALAEAAPDHGADVAALLETEAQIGALHRALARLPEAMRRAVFLKYIQELSDAQIAEALGTSQVNVRKLRSRGIRRLQDDRLLWRDLADDP